MTAVRQAIFLNLRTRPSRIRERDLPELVLFLVLLEIARAICSHFYLAQ